MSSSYAPGVIAGGLIAAYLFVSAAIHGDPLYSMRPALGVLSWMNGPEHVVLPPEVRHTNGETPDEVQALVLDLPTSALDCGLPSAPDDAEIVHIGVYEGAALSDTWIGDEEEMTHAGQLVVEPGDKALYIVAASMTPIIWHVSGATERVAAFVHSTTQWSDGVHSGVIGVDPGRVYGAGAERCLTSAYEVGKEADLKAQAEMVHYLERPADTLITSYEFSSLAVPSGAIENWTLPLIDPGFSGAAAQAWRTGLRFDPQGLVAIDPSQVVSDTGATHHDVWPGHFGLAQLIDRGDMALDTSAATPPTRFLEPGEPIFGALKTDANGAVMISGSYRIVKPTRFPAGLYGAHSEVFVLTRGTPMPEGRPGHSCVVTEEPLSYDSVECTFLPEPPQTSGWSEEP